MVRATERGGGGGGGGGEGKGSVEVSARNGENAMEDSNLTRDEIFASMLEAVNQVTLREHAHG